MDRRWTREAGLPDDMIKGGTSVSGLFDLRPVAASFRNESLQLTPEEVAHFSPLLRRPEISSPTIVAVGGDETGEFLRQSEDFAQLVRSMGTPVEHIVVAGTNHITVVLDALADPDAPLNRAVRRQIGI
jgi:arylformamidase